MTRKVWHNFSELAAKLSKPPDPGSMSKAAARHWAKAADHINKLEQARRREFSLTSKDLYPTPQPPNRATAKKEP